MKNRLKIMFPQCVSRGFLALALTTLFTVLLSAAGASENSPGEQKVDWKLLPGECWWGGLSADGCLMPYTAKTRLDRDLYGNNGGNQAQPLLISSKGRFIWSEQPFSYHFAEGHLTVICTNGMIVTGTNGGNLRAAFDHSSASFFPPSGKLPSPLLFTAPQFNTWIELAYNQNQRDILRYANDIVSNGYPAGVLMIDDTWQENYGTWDFSPSRFQNPKEMMSHLHDLGFKLMLWVCPFVSADSVPGRQLAREHLVLLEPHDIGGQPAIVRWWNGASLLLDLSNPAAQAWFQTQLDKLVSDYGVDGFKFDAGDADFYTGNIVSFKPSLPNDHTTYFAQFGLHYPLNEYRASWKMAGQPLAQRLRDKAHTWKEVRRLIPDILAQGLMGYAFTCPDLIGGGDLASFLDRTNLDEELIVRSAQVHALMPMMQFSMAPWRVLSAENNQICLAAAKLHAQHGSEILRLAEISARTGEPIVKPLAWFWPEAGYEEISDEFILGDDLLVAPVLEKGVRSRKLTIPPGNWKGDDGSLVAGPAVVEISVPLSRLPYFKRLESNSKKPIVSDAEKLSSAMAK